MSERTFTFTMTEDEAEEFLRGLGLRLGRVAGAKYPNEGKVGALAGFKCRMEREFDLQRTVRQAASMGEVRGHA